MDICNESCVPREAGPVCGPVKMHVGRRAKPGLPRVALEDCD